MEMAQPEGRRAPLATCHFGGPQVLQFPVQMLIRFWVNHHLLDIFQRPLWRVVKGRSQEYVKRVCAGACACWANKRQAAG